MFCRKSLHILRYAVIAQLLCRRVQYGSATYLWRSVNRSSPHWENCSWCIIIDVASVQKVSEEKVPFGERIHIQFNWFVLRQYCCGYCRLMYLWGYTYGILQLLYCAVALSCKAGGGYSNYFLMGCAARGLKSLPISKDFSPSKNGWYVGFFEIIANGNAFLRVFLPQKQLILHFFPNFGEMGPSFMDFLIKMGPLSNNFLVKN